MLIACSHVVITSSDVPLIAGFFSQLFAIKPHFANDMFTEFVLPSGFRIAFFKAVGAAAKTFSDAGDRSTSGLGLTTDDVEAIHHAAEALTSQYSIQISGPPKEHPWGEKSFLLIDPQGNRWEITQTPSPSGMLINK